MWEEKAASKYLIGQQVKKTIKKIFSNPCFTKMAGEDLPTGQAGTGHGRKEISKIIYKTNYLL
jgi:hypothetical protein